MKLILKEIRKKNNLTQMQLADKLEVSRSTIAQVESGNNSLSLELAKKISNVFNISLSNLLDNNEAETVGEIYKNDVTGYVNSYYMDSAYFDMLLDRIEMARHSIIKFAEEKNLKPLQSKFDRTSKRLDFENLKKMYYSDNAKNINQKFLDDLYKIGKDCENAILEDLFIIVSYYYKSIDFVYGQNVT